VIYEVRNCWLLRGCWVVEELVVGAVELAAINILFLLTVFFLFYFSTRKYLARTNMSLYSSYGHMNGW